MTLFSRLDAAARKAAGRVGTALGAFALGLPLVPGIGNNVTSGMKLPEDAKGQRLVESREALYGRVTANLGPIGSNISTHPLRGITPERISAIQNQVYTIGWMVDWACLIEDLIKSDSQVRTVHKSGRESVTGAPFTVQPANGSREARAVADYQQTVIDGISDWPRAMGRALLGNAGGYALEDVVYAEKTVHFRYEKRLVSVEAPTPVGFGFVHNKHTRFDIGRGDLLELDSYGGFISPPDWKFLYYEADDDFAVRSRGWAYPISWLSMIKQGAWARWGVVLDLWGIPTPYGLCDLNLWQDPKRRQEMLDSLVKFGRGLPAIFTHDFKIESSAASSSPLDARGMHAAIISAINLEISKLVLGSTLTTEISGTGSYNASETHADTKQARVIGWERNLSGAVRKWMQAALRLAIYDLRADGSPGDVSPRGLCHALGLPPERIIALCGRPTWRVSRETTPKVRMDLYDAAVNKLGIDDLDSDAACAEFGLARTRRRKKRLKGAAVTLSTNGAATSTADAVGGVVNPTEPEDPAKAAAT